ncbi:MAG: acyltransferase family protein [Lysobacterales bacterium]
MNPVHPLFALAAMALALATAGWLARRFGAPEVHQRYASIDGLRGYLAFGVFLSHASVWYYFLRSDRWDLPPSHLYTHLGQSSVTLFFMITGFLFFARLLDARRRGIDWLRLYVSRLLRLTPLYLFAMGLLFVLVLMQTGWALHQAPLELLRDMAIWLGFTVFGQPDLNGLAQTATLTAGVTWSLPYEWFFYLVLPLLGLAIGLKPPLRALAIALATALFAWWQPLTVLVAPAFLGGMTAALLVRRPAFNAFAARPAATVLVLAALGLTVAAFPSAYAPAPIILLALAFALIAGGNSVFGLLVSPAARRLGEMAYSLYLLHGIVLFVAFRTSGLLFAPEALSPLGHWALILLLTPLLVMICSLSFRFIEHPAMQRVGAVSAWLRRLRRRAPSP